MLIGKKVILRAIEREDLRRQWQFDNDLQLLIDSDDDVPRPTSFAQVEAHFEKRLTREEPTWAIEADAKYIGLCGIWHYNQQAAHAALGIAIGDPQYLGKGYGREAINLLLDYGFRQRNLNRIWLSTNSNNERGIRCYRACGFIEEARQRQQSCYAGQWIDAVFMGILRTEWQERE